MGQNRAVILTWRTVGFATMLPRHDEDSHHRGQMNGQFINHLTRGLFNNTVDKFVEKLLERETTLVFVRFSATCTRSVAGGFAPQGNRVKRGFG